MYVLLQYSVFYQMYLSINYFTSLPTFFQPFSNYLRGMLAQWWTNVGIAMVTLSTFCQRWSMPTICQPYSECDVDTMMTQCWQCDGGASNVLPTVVHANHLPTDLLPMSARRRMGGRDGADQCRRRRDVELLPGRGVISRHNAKFWVFPAKSLHEPIYFALGVPTMTS